MIKFEIHLIDGTVIDNLGVKQDHHLPALLAKWEKRGFMVINTVNIIVPWSSVARIQVHGIIPDSFEDYDVRGWSHDPPMFQPHSKS